MQSYAEIKNELDGVNFCFWIMLNDKRVDGTVFAANGIGDFFLIPPEDDPTKILSIVLPLLEYWSDNAKAIGAQAISSGCLDAFQQVGFVLQESRFWLIRPTESLDVNWSSAWLRNPLEPAKAPAIAALLKDAFTGGVGQYGKRDLQAHLASVEQYFDSFAVESLCGRASALIVAKQSGEIAAVCMVELHKNLPTVRFVAVAPDHQRRGLATNLLKHTITVLEPGYDWVKLAVKDGNPAAALYRKLGFIPGDRLQQLSKPVAQ